MIDELSERAAESIGGTDEFTRARVAADPLERGHRERLALADAAVAAAL